MVALLHTGAELPRGAIQKISFPQEVMINADGSETSSERLAWKEAVLAAIEGAYPSQTASNPVPGAAESGFGCRIVRRRRCSRSRRSTQDCWRMVDGYSGLGGLIPP